MTLNYEITVSDPARFALIGESKGHTPSFPYVNLANDGTYVYGADLIGGIDAYSFNGTNLTFIDNIDDASWYYDLYCDGDYIYCCCGSGGMRIYTFDGSTLSFRTSHDDGGYYYGVNGDGTYIYVCTDDELYIYTYDGTTVTKVLKYETPISNPSPDSVKFRGDYIYIAYGDYVGVFTFNGTNMNIIDSVDISADVRSIWVNDDDFIFVLPFEVEEIDVYKFDGDELILCDYVEVPNFGLSERIFESHGYVYVTDYYSPSLKIFTFDPDEEGLGPHSGNIEYLTSWNNPYNAAGTFFDVVEFKSKILATSGDYIFVLTRSEGEEYFTYNQDSKKVISINISNSKAELFSTADIELINPPLNLKVGLLVSITINGENVFKGLISDIKRSSEGARVTKIFIAGLASLLVKDYVIEFTGEGEGEGEID